MFPTERSQAINLANEAAELSPLVSPDNLLSNTRCAWAGGTCYVSFPDYCDYRQLTVTYLLCLLLLMYFISKNF